MRVFNITDHETHALRARGRVCVSVTVGATVIRPGANAHISDSSSTAVAEARALRARGMVAIDALPDWYAPVHGVSDEVSQAATVPPSADTARLVEYPVEDTYPEDEVVEDVVAEQPEEKLEAPPESNKKWGRKKR